MDWIFKSGSQYRTAAQLGISNCRRVCVSLGVDKFTFDIPGNILAETFQDSSNLFAYGSIVEVYRDTATHANRWFYGRVNTIPRSATGSDENISMELVGPWFWLEKTVYTQQWKLALNGVLGDRSVTRVILGQNAVGQSISVGAQISDVITVAAAAATPVLIGSITAPMVIPYDEQLDLTCAEVIQRMARWAPDCVGVFKYNAASLPVFSFLPPSSCTAKTVSVTSGSQLSIRRRDDITVPGVLLNFERTDTIEVNGQTQTVRSLEQQTAGNPSALGALVSTVQLRGSVSTSTSMEQKIVTATFGDSTAGSVSFWRRYIPWLDQHCIENGDASVSISGWSNPDRSIYGSEILISGEVQAWMNKKYAVLPFKAKLAYEVRDSFGTVLKREDDVVLQVQLSVTDATSGTYTTNQGGTIEAAEVVPANMAAQLYAALSRRYHEGSITVIDEECSSTVAVNNLLNISGGLTEWIGMNAMVVEVSEHIDSGTTTIQFAPPPQLAIGDLAAMLSAARNRRPSQNAPVRTTASASGQSGTAVSLSGNSAAQAGSTGGGQLTKIRLSKAADKYVEVGGTNNDITVKDGTSQTVISPSYIQITKGGTKTALLDVDRVGLATNYQVFQKQTSNGVAVTVFDWVRLY